MARSLIYPNDEAQYITVDEFCECVTGVPDEVYRFLWNEVIPRMPRPNGYNDDRDSRSLKKFWRFITDDNMRMKINECLIAHKKEMGL